MHPISEQRRIDIVCLLNQGLSLRKIALKMGMSPPTIHAIKKQLCPQVSGPFPGRSPIISLRQESHILRSLCSGQIDTAVDAQKFLKNTYSLDVSAQTIRNMFKKRGLRSAVKVKKPFLSPRHKKLRLDFAKKYQNWTIYDWRKVVFSDESKIKRIGSDGRKWC